jgi:hypothetical protein
LANNAYIHEEGSFHYIKGGKNTTMARYKTIIMGLEPLFFFLFSLCFAVLPSFFYSSSSFFMGLNGLAQMCPSGLVSALGLLVIFFFFFSLHNPECFGQWE